MRRFSLNVKQYLKKQRWMGMKIVNADFKGQFSRVLPKCTGQKKYGESDFACSIYHSPMRPRRHKNLSTRTATAQSLFGKFKFVKIINLYGLITSILTWRKLWRFCCACSGKNVTFRLERINSPEIHSLPRQLYPIESLKKRLNSLQRVSFQFFYIGFFSSFIRI